MGAMSTPVPSHLVCRETIEVAKCSVREVAEKKTNFDDTIEVAALDHPMIKGTFDLDPPTCIGGE